MKLANFDGGSGTQAGVVRDGTVTEVSKMVGFGSVRTVEDLLRDGRLDELREEWSKGHNVGQRRVDSVKLLSPILGPEKIFCAAVNYGKHGKEGNFGGPKEPYFFTKFRSCIVGDGDAVVIPRISKKADWEVELAVVIGKGGKNIRREDALGHVAGYTVANDISFRDLQFPEGWPEKLNTLGQNWIRGKAMDSALPLGPWLVTRDEVPDPQQLHLSLTVNGVVRQDSSTEDMIFGVDQLIQYVSTGITLSPGDIISTGTPAGVAVFTGAPFLKEGDQIESQVGSIGTLRNRILEERA